MGIRERYTLIIARKSGENKWHDPIYDDPINLSGVDRLNNEYGDQVGFTAYRGELIPNDEWIDARVIWDTQVHILTSVQTVDGITEARWV